MTEHKPVRVLVMLSGKRFAGKDFLTELILTELNASAKDAKARRIALADMCKVGYAKESGADAERLLRDRMYKEEHRAAMTRWYEEQTRMNPLIFQDLAFKQMLEAPPRNGEHQVFVMTDARLKDDMRYFLLGERGEMGRNSAHNFFDRIVTARVSAGDACRRARGWDPDPVKDNSRTETDLDDYDHWSMHFDNDGDAETLLAQVRDRLLPMLEEELRPAGACRD